MEQNYQPEYYYRVDSYIGIREICKDELFRAARWQNGGRCWRHASLIAASNTLQPHEAIYRISFWKNEDDARKDLSARNCNEPHVMLRIKRDAVIEALHGWEFEEDDFLPGRAALIWCRTIKAGERFCDDGIPFSAFEVWEAGTWRPWFSADAVQPDRVRLARSGWLPIYLHEDRGVVLVHWYAVASSGATGKIWILLTTDERSPTNLGNNEYAIYQVANFLLSGPLKLVTGYVVGVLPIHVSSDNIWTEQYSVAVAEQPARSLTDRIFRRAGAPSRWEVKKEWVMRNREEHDLIVRSGLRGARPEAKDSAWLPKSF
ncbi:hypothetical protein AVME950_00050 [Acidovorax sp. SUPP950]|uniref:hypothetical protein n=1 Tax=Acidovorax sp. SUPP950 TaxID=511901 RepID=UPI0023CAD16A|nr:hypothetical protein [Acidovorax sp. SUPP950]GKS73228.1 hypothetical protein AVME950_00050 [Acidovorax sp. SUPP950]